MNGLSSHGSNASFKENVCFVLASIFRLKIRKIEKAKFESSFKNTLTYTHFHSVGEILMCIDDL
jgi:hypothetical protein